MNDIKVNDAADIAVQAVQEQHLKDYRMFAELLQKYPADIVLEQIKLKIEELEK